MSDRVDSAHEMQQRIERIARERRERELREKEAEGDR